MSQNDAAKFGPGADDMFSFDLATGATMDLGGGDDTVSAMADAVTQVRLTFTSAEVGNGFANDSNTMANQDGGLAVRMQAEDGADGLVGPVSRFDDEGVTFESDGSYTFDVRDLVSGAQRGNGFDTVTLGTLAADRIVERFSMEAYYINGGMGDDRITGGGANDFLVGGAGNDMLDGRRGNDSFIGGGGDDMIRGGVGADLSIFTVATEGSDKIDLGRGRDTVNVVAATTALQVRLTFTSAEIGNGMANDGGVLANQDGGLAVRLQAEDGIGGLAGAVSRFDDEGMTFVGVTAGVTFDVRDLVSGTARGDQFDVVVLGTAGNNRLNETSEARSYYVNAGMGDDRVKGGLDADFLVGGAGNDALQGNQGADSLLGGSGNDTFVFAGDVGADTVFDFVSGTDKIDLSAYAVGFADLSFATVGANAVVGVDTDGNTVSDFQITLLNVAAPVEGDFVF